MARAAGRRAASGGMTLLELLLVMALLGVLMGAGMGVLSSINLGKRAAVGSVQNTIRSARNTAVARGAGARVLIDPNAGTLTGVTFEVIGTWQFEGGDVLQGAFELDGTLRGTAWSDDGFVGKSLTFPPGAAATAEVPVQRDPSYDLRDGFRIELAVRAETGGGGRMLRLGDTLGFDLNPRGGFKAWFVAEALDEAGRRLKGGRTVIAAPDGTLPARKWRRVALEYDRRRLALFVDGVALVPDGGPVLESAPVWSIDGPLVLGDPQSSFVGTLDDLVISALSSGEPVKLPEGVRFDPGVPAVIAFDAAGQLDRELHREPLSIPLVFEDGKLQTVRVGMYGTIE